jgi:hypothetical protein
VNWKTTRRDEPYSIYVILLDFRYNELKLAGQANTLTTALRRAFPLSPNLTVHPPSKDPDPKFHGIPNPIAFQITLLRHDDVWCLDYHHLWLARSIQFVAMSTTTRPSSVITNFSAFVAKPDAEGMLKMRQVFKAGLKDETQPVYRFLKSHNVDP